MPIDPTSPTMSRRSTEPLANAVHVAVARVRRRGDRVLVIGAGPIGVLMARCRVQRGAERVLITDPVAGPLALAEAQGAVPLADDDAPMRSTRVADGRGPLRRDRRRRRSRPRGRWGSRSVRPGGRIVEVGLGAPAGAVDYFAVLGKEVTITGSYAWVDDDFAAASG